MSAGRQPPEGPPSCTALNSRPGNMPPPTVKITCRDVEPIGTSTRPPLATLPVSEKIFVPRDLSMPMAKNSSAPCVRIQGTLAYVSTLLMLVGLPQRPETAG